MASYFIFKNTITNEHFAVSGTSLIHLPSPVDGTLFQTYGTPQSTAAQLDVLFTQRIHVTPGATAGTYIESTVVEPESFSIYDEFGDAIEVLCYTDDPAVTGADLVVTANWSPLDELEGDFEIVTWTDEPAATAKRTLSMTAVPKPQFVYLLSSHDTHGDIGSVLVSDTSVGYRDELRILFSPNQLEWYRFNGTAFEKVIINSFADAKALGMKHADVGALTKEQLALWPFETIGLGLYLEDNAQDTITTSVNSISFSDLVALETSVLSDTSLYILNTTARIDLELAGSTVFGTLSDDDLTKVQYRIILNNVPYFPNDGLFTALTAPPATISMEFDSKDIKIDDWNTVKVEFKDSYGTVDYWSKSFVGTYSGLVFKDLLNEFYSDDVGNVLKYLDFGIIYAGQTTMEHEVVLRNQYGYAVKDVQVSVNQSQLSPGMTYELSKTSAPFSPESELVFADILADQQQLSFFIRLKTDLATTPETNGKFNIVAKANRA